MYEGLVGEVGRMFVYFVLFVEADVGGGKVNGVLGVS